VLQRESALHQQSLERLLHLPQAQQQELEELASWPLASSVPTSSALEPLALLALELLAQRLAQRLAHQSDHQQDRLDPNSSARRRD
jgi:formate dehydrogenase maturation protein FdhE